MNYRHAFHAGNFADVFKHVILIGLLDALKSKPAPLCYLDTHAGAGEYDLRGEEARKTGEQLAGVQRLLVMTPPPQTLRTYLDVLRGANAIDQYGRLNVYPGSPLIAARVLRQGDRIVACEQQPSEAAKLKALSARLLHTADIKTQIEVHQRDGYSALGALLPPKERRGLVLIDPPFEAQEAEFDAIEAGLETALARWPGGVYAIWYPIKQQRAIAPLHRWFVARGVKKTLFAELMVHPGDSPIRLNGCGMVIVNLPWQFASWLQHALIDLSRALSADAPATTRVEWLVGE